MAALSYRTKLVKEDCSRDSWAAGHGCDTTVFGAIIILTERCMLRPSFPTSFVARPLRRLIYPRASFLAIVPKPFYPLDV